MKLKTTYHILRLTGFLSFIVLLQSCIDQLPQEEGAVPKVVVVDGQFSDREGPHNILLSKAINLNSQVRQPITDATVGIVSMSGETLNFIHDNEVPGTYTYIGAASTDEAYKLQVRLSDGNEITSTFQSLPTGFPIESLRMEDDLLSFVDENGRSRTRWVLDLYAESNQQSIEEDLYIRYDIETVWQLTEVQCSPLHTTKSCYINDRDVAFDISLLELKKNDQAVDFEQFIYRRFIDEAIGEVMAIKVDALSYNQADYEYWERLKSLFSQTGNITDILPAKVVSNLAPSEGIEAAGIFSVVSQSEKVIFIRNSDVQLSVNPVCGAPGFTPRPRPQECCNCLLRNGASTEKPYYWPF